MIKSMTAYGRGEIEHNGTLFTAEIKTLNNRYRDIILRLPVSLQELEDMIRAKISASVKRGRIEVSLQMTRKDGEINHNLELNRPLIKSYLAILTDMKNEFGLEDNFKTDFLFQIKDAIVVKPDSINLEDISSAVDELLDHTLESMNLMRIHEGKAIEDDLTKRLDLIGDYLSDIEQRSPLVVDEYREKLNNRIKAIADDIEVDEGRLMQEVALFAGRCDITEEIIRARSHLDQFHNYLQMDDSIGRRLDFLIQELNREINTISSKAADASISLNVIEAKAELEKIREQIQNVE